MNKYSCVLFFFLFVGHIGFTQNLINQYTVDESTLFEPYTSGPNYYAGEFQIFFDNLFSQLNEPISDLSPILNVHRLTYRIETVSFPFRIPTFNEANSYSRWLGLPNSNSFDEEPSADLPDLRSNTFFNFNGSLNSPFKCYVDYSGEEQANTAFGSYSSSSSFPGTLLSGLYANGGQDSFENPNSLRVYFPHSILRVTVEIWCPGDQRIEYVPIYADLSRGKLRTFPYCNNFEAGQNPELYDIQIKPRLFESPNPNSNEDWYLVTENGTVNYFNSAGPSQDCLIVEGEQEFSVWPGPYSLIDGPVMNDYADAYAVYDRNQDGTVVSLENKYPDYEPIKWRFYLDKPWDITKINSNERVVFMPEELSIGKPVNNGLEIPSTFDPVQITFPTGYTFKTVLGAYPSRTVLEQMIASGDCSDWRDCHPPTDVNWSKLFVESGSTLIIQDCVSLYDVEVVIRAGGTLQYDPNTVYGRYEVSAESGSNIILQSPDNTYLLCGPECNDPSIF